MLMMRRTRGLNKVRRNCRRSRSGGAGKAHQERKEMNEKSFETNTAQAAQIACIALAKKEHVGNLVAVVNGEPLFEGQIDEYVMRFRRMENMDDPVVWAEWLSARGYTEGDVRKDTVDYLVNFVLMEQAAANKRLEVSETNVDDQVEAARSAAGGQVALASKLAEFGISMEQYRDGIRACLLRTKLINDVAFAVEPPYDIETLLFLKEKKAIGEKAVLSDISDETLDAACDHLFSERKNEVFDKWFTAHRASADIVMNEARDVRP